MTAEYNVPNDTELALLAVRAGAALHGHRLMATVAESCTGGYVAKLLTDVPGSSGWLGCGFVTYSNAAKQRCLGVSPETLRQHGAVSERTVLEMAVGALAASEADVAVSISGIAGPDGGTDRHPVGEVWFARTRKRAGGDIEGAAVHRRFHGTRDEVRRQAAAFALTLLAED